MMFLAIHISAEKCRFEGCATSVENDEINLQGNVLLLHEKFTVVSSMRNLGILWCSLC